MVFAQASITSLITTLFYLIAGLAGISLLVTVHELGHFLFAKLFGVYTPSFSVGFGPALYQKKIGDTVFKLSSIPLGGYVEIAGMAEVGQGDQQEAKRADSRSFNTKPFYQQFLILIGGILFNIIFAYLALTLLFMRGVPSTPLLYPLNASTIIKNVEPDTPAAKAGLLPNDMIITLNKEPVENNLALLLERLTSLAGTTTTITVRRDNNLITLPVTLASRTDGKKRVLGTEFLFKEYPPQSFFSSLKSGVQATNTLIKSTLQAFLSIFKRRSTDGLGGPLAIISQITQGAREGFTIWLLLLVLISVNLAVLNLFPLPILDGGQIVFTTIEAIIGRPLPENIRMGVHYASWVLILLLLIYLSGKDIMSIIRSFKAT